MATESNNGANVIYEQINRTSMAISAYGLIDDSPSMDIMNILFSILGKSRAESLILNFGIKPGIIIDGLYEFGLGLENILSGFEYLLWRLELDTKPTTLQYFSAGIMPKQHRATIPYKFK